MRTALQLMISKPNTNNIQTVVTKGLHETLTSKQVQQACKKAFEAMQTPDPDNPNLWTIHVDGYRIWAILDEGAGDDGRNLLSLLFPTEY